MLSRMTNANEQSESALGIDIGGSSVKAVIVRGDHIHAHAASDTYSLPSETVLRDAVSQAVDRLGQVTATLAGVCAPGVLDAASKQVTHSVNVPGLVGTDLDKLVRQTVPNVRTVEVCTDAFAAAFGYWHEHPSQDRTLALVMGTGVGACVLDAGVPLKVTGESCGHIGQVDACSFDLSPPIANDSSIGTLEAYIGVRALMARFGSDGVTGWLDAPMTNPAWRALIGAMRTAHAIYRPDRIVLLGGVGEQLGVRLDELYHAVGHGLTSVARPDWKLESGSAKTGAAGAAWWAAHTGSKRRGLSATATPSSISELERHISRLIWVGIRGSQPGDPVLEAEIERCKRAHVGGIILFDVDLPQRDRLMREGTSRADADSQSPRNISDPGETRSLVRYLRHRLGPHVVICIDQEGGSVSRLRPSLGYPEATSPATYAKLDDASRAAACDALAESLAMVGVDLNLAPCVDIECSNTNSCFAQSGRCFGSDPEQVASMAAEQIRAMRNAGIGSCIKHFPGHGSATGDTHNELVDITRTWSRDTELAPYRTLINGPTPPDAIMVAHLLHTKLDPLLPASLSPAIITGMLREQLGWQGVVITDSLDMRAIADRYPSGEAAVLAIIAGADVALEGNNLGVPKPCPAPEMHEALMGAVHEGRLSHERLAQSVARLDVFLARNKGQCP